MFLYKIMDIALPNISWLVNYIFFIPVFLLTVLATTAMFCLSWIDQKTVLKPCSKNMAENIIKNSLQFSVWILFQ